ncbi:hypothetical protein IG631_19749 [Alternaria alternata]|nr:hypothetical protein IG631_19749 [Alternaria alternata]
MVPLCCIRRLVQMPGDASVIPGATPTAEQLHHDIANDNCIVFCFSEPFSCHQLARPSFSSNFVGNNPAARVGAWLRGPGKVCKLIL